MKKFLLSLLAIMTIFVPATLMAQWRGGYGCWDFAGRNFGFGGGIMMIVTIIVVALLVFFAIKKLRTQGHPFVSDPMAVLKTRYAKGEITKEQFQEIKKELQ